MEHNCLYVAIIYCIFHLLKLQTVCVVLCTLLSFPIQKTQKYLVKWEEGYVASKLHVYEQPVEFSFLHTCDLASISVPEQLAKTPFLQFPHQASFPIFRSPYLKFCGGGNYAVLQ